MIKAFRHKGLERFFANGDRRGLNAKDCPRIERLLDRLDASTCPEDMKLPGFGLHPLTGERKDTWSVKVNGNWRLTFTFREGNAYDVNLEDYH